MKKHLGAALGFLLLVAMPALGQTISGGGTGVVVPPVVNGLCLIGSGGNAVWGSCSGSGTAVTHVTGSTGQLSCSPTLGDVVCSLAATITQDTTFSGILNAGGTFQIGGTAFSLPVALAQGGTGATTAANARTALGLGTSATVNTGTSGATIGLLNGNLTFGGTDIFTNSFTITALGGSGNRVLSVDNTGLVTAGAAGGTVQSGTGPAMAQYPSGTGTAVGPVTISGDFTIAQGGVGALTNNATARTNIGLGTAATPTFANVTLTSLAGTGARCVHVDATGLPSATAGDCAAGGAAGVTSVGFQVPASSIFTATGGQITTSGNLGFTTAVTSGGVLYGFDAATVKSSAAGAANAIMLWGGAGAQPTAAPAGTSSTLLHGNAAGAPTFGAVALGTEVTGRLPAANMTALATGLVYQGDASSNPVATSFVTIMDVIGSTRGMLAERGVSGWTGLTPGTSGQVLTSNGPGADPSYQAAAGAVSSVAGTTGEVIVSPTTGNTVVSLPSTITTDKTFSGTINMSGTLQIAGAPFALPVSVAQGGTSSTTAAAARTALGLGTAATQNTGTSGATLGLLNATGIAYTNSFTITAFAGSGNRVLGVDNTGLITAGAVGGTVQSGTGPALAQYPSGTGTAVGPVTLGKDATIDQSGNLTLANNTTARGDIGLGTASTPTFTNVTLTALAGTGARCVHVDATGLPSATTGDCAAGGAAGVSSVGFQVPAASIFTATGSPVTTSGNLGFTTAVTSGGVLYGSDAATVSSSVAGAANTLMLWGGAGVQPGSAGAGTSGTLLHGGTPPTFGQVALGTEVSGRLPAANMLALATGLIYQGDASNNPVATAFATVMDAIGSTRGSIPERGATGWTGLVPGTAGNVLTSNGPGADPSYQAPPAGAVTGVQMTVPASSIFGVTGGPTGNVTLALTTTVTSGGVLYGSSGTQVASSGAGTANRLMAWGGAATAPTQLASLGTVNQVLHGNAGGLPTFSAVVAGDISGAIAAANMLPLTQNQVYQGNASNQPASVTFATAMAAIGSTRGSIAENGASGWTGLVPGTAGQVLTSNGAGADPSYQTPGGAVTTPTALTDGSNIAIDLSPSENYTITEAACNRIYSNPTNGVAGKWYSFTRTLGTACPNNVITWGSSFRWPGGTAPLSTASGQVDKFACQALVVSGSNVTTFDCTTPSLAYAPPFSPLSLVTLRLWIDVSDHATTFTGANCTGGTASTDGATVGSLRDKSPDASCWNATGSPVLHTDGSNHWWISPTGSSYFTGATGTGANPTTITQNRANTTGIMGAQFVASTSPQTVFLARTGTGSNTRYACGFNLSAAGQGPQLLARSADGDAQQSVSAGTESGLTATPLAIVCNAEYAQAQYYTYANNGTLYNSAGGTSANSSNTASTAAPTIGSGAAGASPMPSGTRIYQVIVYTAPGTAGNDQVTAATYVCGKMGISC